MVGGTSWDESNRTTNEVCAPTTSRHAQSVSVRKAVFCIRPRVVKGLFKSYWTRCRCKGQNRRPCVVPSSTPGCSLTTPSSVRSLWAPLAVSAPTAMERTKQMSNPMSPLRSEEHTSELQSPCNLVCRLLLEKKKNKNYHVLSIQ